MPKREVFIFFKLALLFFGANTNKVAPVSEFFKYDAKSTREFLRSSISDSDNMEVAESMSTDNAEPGQEFSIQAAEEIKNRAKFLSSFQIPRKDVRKTLGPLCHTLKNHGIDGSREWRTTSNSSEKAKSMLLKFDARQKQNFRLRLSYNKVLKEIFFEFLPKT